MLKTHVGKNDHPHHQYHNFCQMLPQLHGDNYRYVDEVVGEHGLNKNQPGTASDGLVIHSVHQVFDHRIAEHATAPHQNGDKHDTQNIADQTQSPDLHGVTPAHLVVIKSYGEIHEVAGEQLRIGEVDECQRHTEIQAHEVFAQSRIKVMAEIGFDPISKDVHQADNYPGHSGPQRVADEEALVESAFDIDGFENALHHLPAVVNARPHHVFGLEFLFFLSCIVLSRLHNASLTPNVSLSRNPLGNYDEFGAPRGERVRNGRNRVKQLRTQGNEFIRSG